MDYHIKRANPHVDPVAYIDKDGDLVIRVGNSETATAIDLQTPGVTYTELTWRPEEMAPERLIFPGDSITLTF